MRISSSPGPAAALGGCLQPAHRCIVLDGEVIVGNFGGSTIFDYRALGDPVNTAARLESVNKHLGTRLCLSEDVLAGVVPTSARCAGGSSAASATVAWPAR